MSTLILKDVRLAFPNVFEPHAESGKFNAIGIFPPGSDTHKQVEDAAKAVLQDKWGGKVSEGDLRQYCLHDGVDKSKYDGFEGNFYISASNDAQPSVVDRDGKTPLTKASGKPYSGCYVVMYVDLWAQDNKYGKGVNATLRGIQFYKDGAAFTGGRPLATEEFISFEDETETAATGGIFG